MYRRDNLTQVCESMEELKMEILMNMWTSAINIVGATGTGKTALVERLVEDKRFGIDEFRVYRAQGTQDLDWKVPYIHKTSDDDVEVRTASQGVFKEVEDNPDKIYLVFIDEPKRCDPSIMSHLFNLAERRWEGQVKNNMIIIFASNDGDEYKSNFEFTDDDALFSRIHEVEYIPDMKSSIRYMYEHGYHEIFMDAVIQLDDLLSYQKVQPKERTTSLRSYYKYSERLKLKEKFTEKKLSYKEVLNDFMVAGLSYFNSVKAKELTENLTLLESMMEFDIQKELVDVGEIPEFIKNKQGKKIETSGKEMSLLLKANIHIRRETVKNYTYLAKNALNIIKLFSDNLSLFISNLYSIESNCISKMGDSKGRDYANKAVTEFSGQVLRMAKKNSKDYVPGAEELKKELLDMVDII